MVPTGRPNTRRSVDEMALTEERDRWRNGHASHLEFYLAAIKKEAGADIATVSRFLDLLRCGHEAMAALHEAGALRPASEFAFAFAREDLTPQMFVRVLQADRRHNRLQTFAHYFDRHVAVDSGNHSP